MGTIPGQIISELGEVVKQTSTEAAKVPAHVVGAAIESLGGGSQQKSPQSNVATGERDSRGQAQTEKTPFDKFIETDDENIKRTIARAALRQLAGIKEKPKEPTVQERLETKAAEVQEQKAQQAAVTAHMAPVTPPKGKRRGDLYGIRGKQSSEVSRNVRQD